MHTRNTEDTQGRSRAEFDNEYDEAQFQALHEGRELDPRDWMRRTIAKLPHPMRWRKAA